jgi:phosphoglycolate phosphatase
MTRTALVFDLDGTLADTAPDLAGAMNAVLREAGRPELPLSAVRAMVGRGARVLIEKGFSASGGAPSGPGLDAYVARFLEHYRENIVSGSRLFPGVRETIARLTQSAALGVCTNKPIALTELLLDRLQFRAPFACVRGADSAPYRKPDPRHLFDVIDGLGASRARAVLIGDSETDVKTARAAGVPVVLVSFGYSEVPLDQLSADALIDTFEALPAVLERILG